jgi:aspartate carbamoyltransferase regulatory subunit
MKIMKAKKSMKEIINIENISVKEMKMAAIMAASMSAAAWRNGGVMAKMGVMAAAASCQKS